MIHRSYETLPTPDRQDGEPRRIGVEVEFSGLTAPEAAEIVRQACGGRVLSKHAHRLDVTDTEIGTVEVMLDAALAHPDPEDETSWPEAERRLREVGGDIAAVLVPLELVTEPLAREQLPVVDQIIAALRQAGACGTEGSPAYAFGVHLNPEVARLEAEWVAPVLRAFALLEDWLRTVLATDISRRITSFIDPFPRDYLTALSETEGAPSLESLIDTYLTYNPTRNRALDMIPLFLEMDQERVAAVITDGRINARPTFHYRLPDSRLGQPDWTLALAWASWLHVERVAQEPALVRALSDAWRAHSDSWTTLRPDWAPMVESILRDANLGAESLPIARAVP